MKGSGDSDVVDSVLSTGDIFFSSIINGSGNTLDNDIVLDIENPDSSRLKLDCSKPIELNFAWLLSISLSFVDGFNIDSSNCEFFSNFLVIAADSWGEDARRDDTDVKSYPISLLLSLIGEVYDDDVILCLSGEVSYVLYDIAVSIVLDDDEPVLLYDNVFDEPILLYDKVLDEIFDEIFDEILGDLLGDLLDRSFLLVDTIVDLPDAPAPMFLDDPLIEDRCWLFLWYSS